MQFEHVTCPHCGLLCDDLSVEVDQLAVTLLNVEHTQCQQAFAKASFNANEIPSPLVNNQSVDLDQAITKAAELLQSSSQPLISGLIADIQSCREAMALSEKVGGVIDHANGTSLRNSTAVMQRIGEVKTTLAEVRNRADCVIIIGSGVLKRFPRLVDRVLTPSKTLGNENSARKKIYILDINPDDGYTAKLNLQQATYVHLNMPLLESLVYKLQEVITKPEESFTEIDDATRQLMELHHTICASDYTTFIWASAEFNRATAQHTIQALTETIKTLMVKRRCVGLPLGGSKGEIGANQVATWQSGVALPVAFMGGTPVHDPVRFDGARMLENREADCLVWIATYSPDDESPQTDFPAIVLGHPKMQCDHATVFIPTGIPGIDSRGLACRTDGVATLPLPKLRDSVLPAASDVLQKISQLL